MFFCGGGCLYGCGAPCTFLSPHGGPWALEMSPTAVGGSICNTERAQFATHRMAKYWLNLQHRDGSICNTQRHTNNPLGFWVGTVGGGVRGIRGVRVGDCVHTRSYGVRGENCYRGDGFPVSALDFSTTAGSKLSFYADNSTQERLQSCGVPCVNNMCQTVRSSGTGC